MIPWDTYGHNNNSNINVEAIEYLKSPSSVVNLAREDIENGRRDLQMPDYLETWDDSNSI